MNNTNGHLTEITAPLAIVPLVRRQRAIRLVVVLVFCTLPVAYGTHGNTSRVKFGRPSNI